VIQQQLDLVTFIVMSMYGAVCTLYFSHNGLSVGHYGTCLVLASCDLACLTVPLLHTASWVQHYHQVWRWYLVIIYGTFWAWALWGLV